MKAQKISKIFIAIFIILSASNIANASESVGSIDENFYLTKLCRNSDCSLYQIVNFKPTNGTPVVITDSGLTGDLWFETSGWVSLNPVNGGVLNTQSGVLSGLGWGQIASWVNFDPSNGGVSINNNGEFEGWAWVSGGYGGWVKFDCTDSSTCIKTDWRPVSVRGSGGEEGGSVATNNSGSSIGNGSPSSIIINTNSSTTEINSNVASSSSNVDVNESNLPGIINELFREIGKIQEELRAEIVNFSKSNNSDNNLVTVDGSNSSINLDRNSNSNDGNIKSAPNIIQNKENKFSLPIIILILALITILGYRFKKKKSDNRN